MNHIPDNLIEKIRKLLALSSNNSSQGEAELALQKAKELAVRHDIELTSIEVFSGVKKEESVLKSNPIDMGARESVCQKFINMILQNHFNVRVIYSGSRAWGRRLTIVGKKSDMEIAAYIHFFLNNEFMRLWHKYREQNPSVITMERNSFLWGIYMGFTDKLKKAAQDAENQAFTEMQGTTEQVGMVKNQYALAKITNSEQLDKALKVFYPNLKTTNRSAAGIHSILAQRAGYAAGQTIVLRKVLNGASSVNALQ